MEIIRVERMLEQFYFIMWLWTSLKLWGSSSSVLWSVAPHEPCSWLWSSGSQGINYNDKRYFFRALSAGLCKFEAFTRRKLDFRTAREYLTRWWGENSQREDKWGRNQENVLPFCLMEFVFGELARVLALIGTETISLHDNVNHSGVRRFILVVPT